MSESLVRIQISTGPALKIGFTASDKLHLKLKTGTDKSKSYSKKVFELGLRCFIVSADKKLLLCTHYRHTLWLNLHIAAKSMETARAITSFGLIHPSTYISFSFQSDLVFYKELVQIWGAMDAQSSAKKVPIHTTSS